MLLEIFLASIGSIVVLAVALWLLSSRDDNPFKESGLIVTLVKCIVLVVGVKVLDVMIYNGTKAMGDPTLQYAGLAIVVAAWFVGIMYLFQRNFLSTVLLTVTIVALNWCATFAATKLD